MAAKRFDSSDDRRADRTWASPPPCGCRSVVDCAIRCALSSTRETDGTVNTLTLQGGAGFFHDDRRRDV